MPTGNSNKSIGLFVLYVNFVVNFIASVIATTLMFYMWKRKTLKMNIFIKCVAQLTVWQCVYEFWCPWLFEVASMHDPGMNIFRGVATTFTSLGGLGASLFSFLMLISALFTVHTGRMATRKEQYGVIMSVYVFMIGYSIYMGTIGYKASATNFHSWRRAWLYFDYLTSILISASAMCALRLYYVMIRKSIHGERSRSPLYHLLRRVAIYPVLVSVSRSGDAFYKQIYGTTIDAFPVSGAPGMQIFWYYYSVIMMPFAGIGALLAFMGIQAGAWRSLILMLHMERFFALPPPPAAWAEENEKQLAIKRNSQKIEPERDSVVQHSYRQRSLLTVKQDNDRLEEMSESDLARAAMHYTRDLASFNLDEGGGAKSKSKSKRESMADNEEGIGVNDSGIELREMHGTTATNTMHRGHDEEEEEEDDHNSNYQYSENNHDDGGSDEEQKNDHNVHNTNTEDKI